jgi:DNA-binding transcriptional regulator PaaX
VLLTLPAVLVGRALVDQAGDRQWLADICRRAGVKEGAAHPVLQRMFDAGWLVDEWEGKARPPNRRYYRVTDHGLVALEGLLARARGDGRFTHLFTRPPTPTFQPPRHGRAQA